MLLGKGPGVGVRGEKWRNNEYLRTYSRYNKRSLNSTFLRLYEVSIYVYTSVACICDVVYSLSCVQLFAT